MTQNCQGASRHSDALSINGTSLSQLHRDSQVRLWRMCPHNSHTEKCHIPIHYVKFCSLCQLMHSKKNAFQLLERFFSIYESAPKTYFSASLRSSCLFTAGYPHYLTQDSLIRRLSSRWNFDWANGRALEKPRIYNCAFSKLRAEWFRLKIEMHLEHS